MLNQRSLFDPLGNHVHVITHAPSVRERRPPMAWPREAREALKARLHHRKSTIILWALRYGLRFSEEGHCSFPNPFEGIVFRGQPMFQEGDHGTRACRRLVSPRKANSIPVNVVRPRIAKLRTSACTMNDKPMAGRNDKAELARNPVEPVTNQSLCVGRVPESSGGGPKDFGSSVTNAHVREPRDIILETEYVAQLHLGARGPFANRLRQFILRMR